MTVNNEKLLLDRFAAEFEKGLANVKFFVVNSGRVNYDELVDDVLKFETAKCRQVTMIDRDSPTVEYNAPFN